MTTEAERMEAANAFGAMLAACADVQAEIVGWKSTVRSLLAAAILAAGQGDLSAEDLVDEFESIADELIRQAGTEH